MTIIEALRNYERLPPTRWTVIAPRLKQKVPLNAPEDRDKRKIKPGQPVLLPHRLSFDEAWDAFGNLVRYDDGDRASQEERQESVLFEVEAKETGLEALPTELLDSILKQLGREEVVKVSTCSNNVESKSGVHNAGSPWRIGHLGGHFDCLYRRSERAGCRNTRVCTTSSVGDFYRK